MTKYTVDIMPPEGGKAPWPTSLRMMLQNDLGFEYGVTVLEHEDPENLRKDRGKIDAIKRIRQELNTSLIDSKFLVDSAQDVGHARWANVRVYYSDTGYQVVILNEQ
jgi:hypothetical protein